MASTTINQVPKGVVPFSEAIKIERLDSHTYAADISKSFRIGTVPNGGYSSSTILQAASIHLGARGQKDFLTVHFEFLNRTETGPAIIIIEDIKLGRTLSTIHATLYQGGLLPNAPWITQSTSKKELSAYLTMTNLSKENGISLPTNFTLTPSPPPPTPNFSALEMNTNQDPNWTLMDFPADNGFGRVQCLQNCVYYVPRRGQSARNIIDVWVRLSCGENITDPALGYIADCWPYVVEAYRPTSAAESDKGPVPFRHDSVFWYPTVVMNIEVKKSLGEKGKRWLQLRVASKQVRNGRLDLEVIILDNEGDIVALSQHVNLILGGERNTAGREGAPKGGKL